MRRRELMFLLAGATTAARALRAQQKAPVIGFLGSASPGPNAPFTTAFLGGLSETGYVEGQNVELCAELHDRMPVVMGYSAWPAWLGEEPAEPSELKALLLPYPSEAMTSWPVSSRVGNVKNNDPSLIEPIIAIGVE